MTAQVREIDVAALGPLVKIAGGGQGLVYGLRDDPDGPVYKEYLPRVVDDLDVDALRAFVRFADELDDADRAALLSRVAWPEAVVRRDGVVRGFLMRRVPPEYRTELRFGADTSDELATAQFLLNPPEYLTKVGLRVTQRFRVEFLADTADALELLHRLGVVVGDLSPNNLLFSLTNRPRCFFVDSDSMRLAGQSVLPQVETPDWRVGDIGDEELATRASDVYKFGLLVVRLYAADQHTTDLAAIPTRLRRQVGRCLATAPDERPRVRDLHAPLARVLRDLPETPVEEPEPEPQPIPQQRAAPQEQPRPRPRQQAATPAPIGSRRPRWAPILIGFGALVGVLFGVFGGGGTSGGGSLPTLPPYTPPAADLPTVPGYPNDPLPTYAPLPTYDPLPTYLPTYLPPLPSILPLACLTDSNDDVRGGAGLSAARVAVGELCGAAPADLSPQLRAHAPYRSATIVGLFAEGTRAPSATVDMTDESGQCWRMRVGFDAGYTVRSVGPLSPCG